MTQPPKENLPPKKQPSPKTKGLEDALRANLMKRKQQARARTDSQTTPPTTPTTETKE